MVIKLLGKVPREVCVGLSGGTDSMAALHFLSNSNRKITALHFNHNTAYSNDAESLVKKYCSDKNIPLIVGRLKKELPKGASKEDFWRKERYDFFNKNSHGLPVITCHHLNDAVETWVFTSLHGNPKLIPHKRDNFIRPFLITEKETLTRWCYKHKIPYLEDPSNKDTSYMRNFIRHKMIPSCEIVNPGLKKVIYKKLLNSFKGEY